MSVPDLHCYYALAGAWGANSSCLCTVPRLARQLTVVLWGVTFLQVLVEAARVFGPSGRNTASRNDADGMIYTLSVLKEALRR